MKIIISNSSITMKTQQQLVPLTGILTEYAEEFSNTYPYSYRPYANCGTAFMSYTGVIAGIRLMADISDTMSISIYKIKIQNNAEVSRTLIQTFLPQGMTQGTKVTNDLIFDTPVTLAADEYLFIDQGEVSSVYNTGWKNVPSGYAIYFYNNGSPQFGTKVCVSFDWLVPSEE